MEFPDSENSSQTNWHKIKSWCSGTDARPLYSRACLTYQPEAPVFVLKHQREQEVLGGVANVGRNLVGLGPKPLCWESPAMTRLQIALKI